MGIPRSRITARHARISRFVDNAGFREYRSGKVDFLGGSPKDLTDAHKFVRTFLSLGAIHGFLPTLTYSSYPYWVSIPTHRAVLPIRRYLEISYPTDGARTRLVLSPYLFSFPGTVLNRQRLCAVVTENAAPNPPQAVWALLRFLPFHIRWAMRHGLYARMNNGFISPPLLYHDARLRTPSIAVGLCPL